MWSRLLISHYQAPRDSTAASEVMQQELQKTDSRRARKSSEIALSQGRHAVSRVHPGLFCERSIGPGTRNSSALSLERTA